MPGAGNQSLPLQVRISKAEANAFDRGAVRHLPPELIRPLDHQWPITETLARQRQRQQGRPRGDLIDPNLRGFVDHHAAVGDAVDHPAVATNDWFQLRMNDILGGAPIIGGEKSRLHRLLPLSAGA